MSNRLDSVLLFVELSCKVHVDFTFLFHYFLVDILVERKMLREKNKNKHTIQYMHLPSKDFACLLCLVHSFL